MGSMQQKIVVGTRGSVLALKQADIASDALKKICPDALIEIRIIKTEGDTNLDPIPLDTIGKGWFTREIEDALIQGEIDCAVHSLKDMAEDMPGSLEISAYLEREDARDVLITKNGEPLEKLRRGAVIGTDSTRRHVQMLALRDDLHMKSLRGNVPTRIEKLFSGSDYDAIVLAAAGLKRLGLGDKATQYFEQHEMTSAPGQGILALQSNKDSPHRKLFAKCNDIRTSHAAHLERTFSRAMGGGCKSPTGAYAWQEGTWWLIGMREQKGKILREYIKGNDENIGMQLAKTLLDT